MASPECFIHIQCRFFKKKFSETTKDLLIDQIRNSHFEFLDNLVEGEGVMPEVMVFSIVRPFYDLHGKSRELRATIRFSVY